MAAGRVVDQALRQPDHGLDAEMIAQHRLHLARSRPGLRLGSSTDSAQTSAVPSPSTWMAPPSSTIGAAKRGTFRRSQIASASAASWAYSGERSP